MLGEPVSETPASRGEFETFDPKTRLDGQGTETRVEFGFDNNVTPNDWLILTLILESGERALYVVPAG